MRLALASWIMLASVMPDLGLSLARPVLAGAENVSNLQQNDPPQEPFDGHFGINNVVKVGVLSVES